MRSTARKRGGRGADERGIGTRAGTPTLQPTGRSALRCTSKTPRRVASAETTLLCWTERDSKFATIGIMPDFSLDGKRDWG